MNSSETHQFYIDTQVGRSERRLKFGYLETQAYGYDSVLVEPLYRNEDKKVSGHKKATGICSGFKELLFDSIDTVEFKGGNNWKHYT